jgi:hypothetical protein
MAYSNWKNMNKRILKALQTGQDFTANQLRARFGIRRVSDRISELRKAGYAIYLNEKTTRWGEKIRVYRLGAPSRAMIATAQFVKSHGFYPYEAELADCLNNYVAA